MSERVATANAASDTTPTTLGLDDDLDSVELLIEVERVFNISITQDDAGKMLTVGDLFSCVTKKVTFGGGEKCRTAMSYFRLRKALRELGIQGKISPETSLNDLAGKSPKKFCRRLSATADLNLPPILELTTLGYVGCLALIFSIVAMVGLVLLHINPWIISAVFMFWMIFGIVLLCIDQETFGPNIKTIGDLSEYAGSYNYGAFAHNGGRNTPSELWSSFLDILAPYSNQLSKEDIMRDTLLLQSQMPTRV